MPHSVPGASGPYQGRVTVCLHDTISAGSCQGIVPGTRPGEDGTGVSSPESADKLFNGAANRVMQGRDVAFVAQGNCRTVPSMAGCRARYRRQMHVTSCRLQHTTRILTITMCLFAHHHQGDAQPPGVHQNWGGIGVHAVRCRSGPQHRGGVKGRQKAGPGRTIQVPPSVSSEGMSCKAACNGAFVLAVSPSPSVP